MFVGTTNNNIETGEVEKVYSWPQVYFKIKEFTKKHNNIINATHKD